MLPKIVFASLFCCPEFNAQSRHKGFYQYRLLFFLFHHYYLCNDLQNGPSLLSCYNVKRVSGYTLHKIINMSITYQYKNSLYRLSEFKLISKPVIIYVHLFSIHSQFMLYFKQQKFRSKSYFPRTSVIHTNHISLKVHTNLNTRREIFVRA